MMSTSSQVPMAKLISTCSKTPSYGVNVSNSCLSTLIPQSNLVDSYCNQQSFENVPEVALNEAALNFTMNLIGFGHLQFEPISSIADSNYIDLKIRSVPIPTTEKVDTWQRSIVHSIRRQVALPFIGPSKRENIPKKQIDHVTLNFATRLKDVQFSPHKVTMSLNGGETIIEKFLEKAELLAATDDTPSTLYTLAAIHKAESKPERWFIPPDIKYSGAVISVPTEILTGTIDPILTAVTGTFHAQDGTGTRFFWNFSKSPNGQIIVKLYINSTTTVLVEAQGDLTDKETDESRSFLYTGRVVPSEKDTVLQYIGYDSKEMETETKSNQEFDRFKFSFNITIARLPVERQLTETAITSNKAILLEEQLKMEKLFAVVTHKDKSLVATLKFSNYLAKSEITLDEMMFKQLKAVAGGPVQVHRCNSDQIKPMAVVQLVVDAKSATDIDVNQLKAKIWKELSSLVFNVGQCIDLKFAGLSLKLTFREIQSTSSSDEDDDENCKLKKPPPSFGQLTPQTVINFELPIDSTLKLTDKENCLSLCDVYEDLVAELNQNLLVCQTPANGLFPFLLYGKAGLGKTALILEWVKEYAPKASVIMIHIPEVLEQEDTSAYICEKLALQIHQQQQQEDGSYQVLNVIILDEIQPHCTPFNLATDFVDETNSPMVQKILSYALVICTANTKVVTNFAAFNYTNSARLLNPTLRQRAIALKIKAKHLTSMECLQLAKETKHLTAPKINRAVDVAKATRTITTTTDPMAPPTIEDLSLTLKKLRMKPKQKIPQKWITQNDG